MNTTNNMTTPNRKVNETQYTSPCKIGGGGEYFREGMRVMFFNIRNVDLPAFAVGVLGNRVDPNTPAFNVTWENPIVSTGTRTKEISMTIP
jgi:hypothetical protein